MNFYTITLNFFGINPTVSVVGNTLHSVTPLFLQILSLFSYSQHITVDRKIRFISIKTRWLWFLKKYNQIPFDRIDYIDTHFKSTGAELGWKSHREQFEIFSIILVLKNPPQKYTLIKFRGEGSSYNTGISGFMIPGDRIIDFTGNQKKAFQEYLELLKKFTGAGLMPSFSEEFQKKHIYRCEKCGRKSWLDQKCMYCGGTVKLDNK